MGLFNEMLEEVRSGKDPVMVVEAAAGPMGQDRSDDVNTAERAMSAFSQITGEIGAYNGYVGPDWITHTADQLKTADPEGRMDLANWARANREQYVGSARVDCEGCYDMWDNIYKGVVAFSTTMVPPPMGQLG